MSLSGGAGDLETVDNHNNSEVGDNLVETLSEEFENTSDDKINNNENYENLLSKPKTSSNFQIRRIKRKHKKSRNSCDVCKERKIKCDQRIPICSYCERKNIECPYLMMTPYQIHRIFNDENDGNKDSSLDFNYKINSSFNGLLNTYNNIIKSDHKINLKENISFLDYDGNVDSNLNSYYEIHEIGRNFIPSSIIDNSNYYNTNTSISTDFNFQDLGNVNSNKGEDFVIGKIKDFKANKLIYNQPLHSNTKTLKKSFNINRNVTVNILETFMNRSILMGKFIVVQDIRSLVFLFNRRNVDAVIRENYLQLLATCQLFNSLMRKTHMLFAMEYYKNILLKQPIVPFLNYKNKLSISGICEKDSVIYLDKVTKLIKKDRLPSFGEFSMAAGCFQILDDCLAYHFKNGLKYDIGFEEGEKAIGSIGIFSTGYYALILETTPEAILMCGSNILSIHLIDIFKRFLIRNYNLKILDEFKIIIENSKSRYEKYDVNYENLKIFCDEQLDLLKTNIKAHSLMGFHDGFLIRFCNSFRSILPFDLTTFGIENETKFIGDEVRILTYLSFYTLSLILDGIVPGIQNLISGSFFGFQWDVFELDNIPKLIELLKTMKNKKFKLIIIFLIRTGLYFKCYRSYYRQYLLNYSIETILDPDSGLTINERYLKLLQFKEDNIINIIPMTSFMLKKGQFIQRWNYPNKENIKPKRKDKVSENKIMNHFKDEDELFEDFISNNNGFFSLDFNPIDDLAKDKSVTMLTTFIDISQIKVLWKLVTYIRNNDL